MEMTLDELRAVLEQMDVPAMRMQLRPEDIAWLRRNLAVRNADHPLFTEATTILSRLK